MVLSEKPVLWYYTTFRGDNNNYKMTCYVWTPARMTLGNGDERKAMEVLAEVSEQQQQQTVFSQRNTHQ